MSFNNSGEPRNPYYNYNNNMNPNLGAVSRQHIPAKNLSLNSPMIERVYKAKPGCSACGKKVA